MIAIATFFVGFLFGIFLFSLLAVSNQRVPARSTD